MTRRGTGHVRHSHDPRGSVAALTIGATGIVFGAIGTSPLYAIDQIFLGHGGVPLTHENVLGGISLVIWALTVIVTINYAIFVLRAQNDGEGGVFALYGLLHRYKNHGIMIFLWSLMLGAGLLFGDGIITPAISVLAAVEGFGVAAPALGRAVIPITAILLTALFAVQIKGTSGIGKVFGPILSCLVYRPGYSRSPSDRASHGDSAGIQSPPRSHVSHARRALQGAPGSGRFDTRCGWRRGDVCRLGTLWRASNSDELVHAGVSRLAAQLSGARRLFTER